MLLTAGEFANGDIRLLFQIDRVNDFVDAPWIRIQRGEMSQRLAYRESAQVPGLLQDDPNPRLESTISLGRVHSQHTDISRCSVTKTLEDLDRYRLPRAIGSEQDERLAPIDGEGDVVHRNEVAVLLGQPFNTNGWFAHFAHSKATT